MDSGDGWPDRNLCSGCSCCGTAAWIALTAPSKASVVSAGETSVCGSPDVEENKIHSATQHRDGDFDLDMLRRSISVRIR